MEDVRTQEKLSNEVKVAVIWHLGAVDQCRTVDLCYPHFIEGLNRTFNQPSGLADMAPILLMDA